MDIKIYTVTYMPCGKLPSDIYVPIVAGAEGRDLSDFDLRQGYVFDNDDADNISSENPTYSEFTALYYMWKHADEEIIGEAHYRRFFVRMSWPGYLLAALKKGTSAREKLGLKKAIRKSDIEKIFSKGYNCILPKKTCRFPQGLYNQYAHCTDPYLLDASRQIIKEKCPEFIPAFDRTMKANDYYLKCIFIMPRDLFRQYMSWMFMIFDELKARYDFKGERELAFLGERIMNVWMEHMTANKTLRPKELFYYNTEIDPRGALASGRDMELCIPYSLGKHFEGIMKNRGR